MKLEAKFWHCYQESDNFLSIPVEIDRVQGEDFVVYYLINERGISVRASHIDESWDDKQIIESDKQKFVIKAFFEKNVMRFI